MHYQFENLVLKFDSLDEVTPNFAFMLLKSLLVSKR